MALVNFSNAKVVRSYTSPHQSNVWGLIQAGNTTWRKAQAISPDGTTNMAVILKAAVVSGQTVSGSYDDTTGQLFNLYLN